MFGRLKNWWDYGANKIWLTNPEVFQNFKQSLYGPFAAFDIRITEILAGASFAGLLTLAFIAPLTFSQKLSACIFSITLVSFIAVRLDAENGTLSPKRAFRCSVIWWASIASIVIGYWFFVWSFSRVAAILYMIASVAIPVVLHNSDLPQNENKSN